MLYVKLKKIIIFALVAFLASSILFATNSYAALFEDLTSKGAEIFKGMREIIYAVAGFGIVAIAIGGFFGNFNWKWLGAIIIGPDCRHHQLYGGRNGYYAGHDHRYSDQR